MSNTFNIIIKSLSQANVDHTPVNLSNALESLQGQINEFKKKFPDHTLLTPEQQQRFNYIRQHVDRHSSRSDLQREAKKYILSLALIIHTQITFEHTMAECHQASLIDNIEMLHKKLKNQNYRPLTVDDEAIYNAGTRVGNIADIQRALNHFQKLYQDYMDTLSNKPL